MTSAPAPPQVVRYVAFVATLAALALGAAVAHAALAPPAGWAWVAVPAVALGIFVTQRRALVFHFRGQRTTNVLDEPVVAVALLLLPMGAAVLALAAGLAAAQVASRRIFLKGVYNFSAYAGAAAGSGVAFFAATTAGAPVFVAAPLAALVYPVVTNVLLAGLFARLERASYVEILRDRLGGQIAVNAALGAGLVLCAMGLWALHPLALVGLAPFVLLAGAFLQLDARAERESRIRERLEEVTDSISSATSIDEVADQILDRCGELFLAGAATLSLDATPTRPARSWSRVFEGGPADDRPAIEAPLAGRGGRPIGVLRVSPAQRAPAANAIELDRPLVRVLARQIATTLELADAFHELVSLKDEHEGIVRSAPAGILRIDGGANVARWNDRFAADVGDPAATWAALRAHPALASAVAGLLEGRAFRGVEIQVEERFFAVSGEPAQEAGPEAGPAGGVLLFHDVTSHHQAEAARRSNHVARSLVRRIVLDLVGGLGASEVAITQLGRRLAAEVRASEPQEFVSAFRSMGLGDLRLVDGEDGSYVFEADDLLERRPRSTQPTCHLARGFVEGVVGQVHASAALGAETRCQSQGHERCRFVVRPKAAEPPRPARGSARRAPLPRSP